jgi:hypothetical protein
MTSTLDVDDQALAIDGDDEVRPPIRPRRLACLDVETKMGQDRGEQPLRLLLRRFVVRSWRHDHTISGPTRRTASGGPESEPPVQVTGLEPIAGRGPALALQRQKR